MRRVLTELPALFVQADCDFGGYCEALCSRDAPCVGASGRLCAQGEDLGACWVECAERVVVGCCTSQGDFEAERIDLMGVVECGCSGRAQFEPQG